MTKIEGLALKVGKTDIKKPSTHMKLSSAEPEPVTVKFGPPVNDGIRLEGFGAVAAEGALAVLTRLAAGTCAGVGEVVVGLLATRAIGVFFAAGPVAFGPARGAFFATFTGA